MAESEPHTRSSRARCDRDGRPATICLTVANTCGATRLGSRRSVVLLAEGDFVNVGFTYTA